MNVKKNIRKWVALIAAIILYFVVHEGAHYLYAVSIGAFKQVDFIGLGVQIDIFREQVTNTQLGIFCLVGPAATILAGYAIALMAGYIVKSRSLLIRAAAYYISLVLLMVDPLYLAVLYSFVGGGDMNGIALVFPELAVRVVFGVIAAVNLFIIFKYLLPLYRKAYQA